MEQEGVKKKLYWLVDEMKKDKKMAITYIEMEEDDHFEYYAFTLAKPKKRK